MLKLTTSFLLSFLLLTQFSNAQTRDEFGYNSEIVWGVNKNTNGGLIGGVMLRYSRVVGSKMIESFGVELSNVKHPKEVRYTTFIGNSYIWGKQNYLYSVRGQYGREILLFKKAPQQGVQITALAAIGPSIGLQAPYFIEYATGPVTSVREPFNPDVHLSQNNILGTGRIFEGLTQSDLRIGANAKVGLNFEFGTFRSNVTGIETGLMFEGFNQEIVLIPTAQNRQYFTSAFVTLYYGKRK
jgi:hypothetical protein